MAEKQNYAEQNKARLKEITESIEAGIKELFDSEKYRRYLNTMSRFHRYSVNNVMLIYMQRPDATQVAGFNKWKDQFGRHVKKGEKGIQIIAPTPYKKKIEEAKLDPETKAPLLDKDGAVIMEEKTISIPRFKAVSVFDVSQTVGKPLPELASDLHGNVGQYEVFMEALCRTSPVPMEVKPIGGDMDGFFHLTDQSITIRAGMSQVQTVSAAVHEIAHAMLHNPKNEPVLDDEGQVVEKDRRTEEVEAESISYAVCQYYGIETADNSFGYIAEWSQGKELKELRSSLEIINQTASEIITGVDRHFAEICKEQDIDRSVQEQATDNLQPGSLFCVNEAIYIHIEPDGDGHSYTAYLKEGMQRFDDGTIDLPNLNDREALLEAAAMLGLSPYTVRSVPLDTLVTGIDTSQEQLYILDDKTYLHIQPSEVGYWDFTFYDKATLEQQDGGFLETPGLDIGQARDAILFEMAVDAETIETVPAAQLQETLDTITAAVEARVARDIVNLTEQGIIEPPLGGGNITRVEVKSYDPETPLPHEYILPDHTITVPMMEHYGYRDETMLPLSKDRATELLDLGLTVYMLHDDNSDAMVFDTQDIVEHDGLFGITREEWDAVRQDIPLRDVEKRFLDSPADAFAIYQLNQDAPAGLRFTRYERLSQPPSSENYSPIYVRELYPGDDVQTNLENIYHIFNEDRPMDFTGHSLSVSDIIALKRDGEVSYHYCDWIGFKELSGFKALVNHLKAAELSMEDDYGMIDGIINNGPKATVAELEQQARSGKPISLMNLADAVHRESSEKRKSVVKQLKNQPTQKRKHKTAHKRSAEREI